MLASQLSLCIINLVILDFGRSQIIFRKCCPANFVYNYASKQCEQVKQGFVIEWIPDQLKNNSLLNSSAFIMDVPRKEELNVDQEPCPSILVKAELPNYKIFPLAVSPKTNLQLVANDEESLVINGSIKVKDWCLDAAINVEPKLIRSGRTWVALLCKCLRQTCFTSCCQRGHRLNIKKANARSFMGICSSENVTDWFPSGENLRLPSTPKAWYHRFMTVWEYADNCLHSVHNTIGKARRPKIITDFTIDKRGILKSKRYTANAWSYCVAESMVGGRARTVAMYCDKSEFNASFEAVITQSILAAVGGVFTALTLLVHLLSAELRKGIKGLSLIAHCAAMLVAYVVMASRPLVWAQRGEACTVLGILTHFFLLSAFFWLNVRAIVIYATFRSLSSMLSGLSLSTKSFPLYALYAFGVPAAISGFMAWAQYADDKSLPNWITWPDIDEASCWFKGPLGRALYFSLPMGVLILINVCLFISTLFKITAFKKENHAALNTKEDRPHSNIVKENLKFDTQRLKIFAKLSLIMGLTYLSEFFSWFNYLFSFYWYASNVAIALRAIIVFAVFCCNSKVYNSLRKQYPAFEKTFSRSRAFKKTSSNGRN